VKAFCDYVPEINETKEVFERAKVDPEAQELMRVSEKAIIDCASDIKTAEDKGREEEHRKNGLI